MEIFGKDIVDLEEFFEQEASKAARDLEISFKSDSRHALNWTITFYPHDQIFTYRMSFEVQSLIDISFHSKGKIYFDTKNSSRKMFISECVCAKDKFYYKYNISADYTYTVRIDFWPTPSTSSG